MFEVNGFGFYWFGVNRFWVYGFEVYGLWLSIVLRFAYGCVGLEFRAKDRSRFCIYISFHIDIMYKTHAGNSEGRFVISDPKNI